MRSVCSDIACSDIKRHAAACSGMQQNATECSGIQRHTTVCSCIQRHAAASSGMHRCTDASMHRCIDAPMHRCTGAVYLLIGESSSVEEHCSVPNQNGNAIQIRDRTYLVNVVWYEAYTFFLSTSKIGVPFSNHNYLW